jgi:hypothetical protein
MPAESHHPAVGSPAPGGDSPACSPPVRTTGGEMLLRLYRRSRHAAPGPCRPTPRYPQYIKGFA